MIRINFKSTFIRQFKKLEEALSLEVREKLELFKDPKNHAMLKVHKLHGPLKGYHSFSVNYKTRIIFDYQSKTEVVFMTIGDHDVYDT